MTGPAYSFEYLFPKKTIRFTELGELKEETDNFRVYLRIDVIVEERMFGRWKITEIYPPVYHKHG